MITVETNIDTTVLSSVVLRQMWWNVRVGRGGGGMESVEPTGRLGMVRVSNRGRQAVGGVSGTRSVGRRGNFYLQTGKVGGGRRSPCFSISTNCSRHTGTAKDIIG